MLTDDYDFPATNYPELFVVEKGGLLHETQSGKQAIREGFAMVVHPGHRHTVRKPEGVVLSRIRYLPEWFTMEYDAISGMPDVLTLFFDQSWLQYPREDAFHVFQMRNETRGLIEAEIQFLQQILKTGQHLSPVPRLSLLKMMSLVAQDFERFWRGAGSPKMKPPVKFAMDVIEKRVISGESFREPSLRSDRYDKIEIESAFRTFTGLSPIEYCERRRIFHAAHALIATDEDPSSIARDTGFPDTAKFQAIFAETFEISPRVYREKFRSLIGPEETPLTDLT